MKQATAPPNSAKAPLDAASVARGANQPSEQAIRERAYSIYESHPDASRAPEFDWFEAEKQLRRESDQASRAPRR